MQHASLSLASITPVYGEGHMTTLYPSVLKCTDGVTAACAGYWPSPAAGAGVGEASAGLAPAGGAATIVARVLVRW